MTENYFDNYIINKDGTIYSKYAKKNIKPYLSNSGYLRVTFWNKGKSKHFSIHRLVAETYLSNYENKPCVNHKNGNKLDNRVENLEWVSLKENMQHAYKNNLAKNKTTKVIQYSKNMEAIKVWNSIKEVEETLHINHANIVTVCKQNTKRKYAGGYIWRYEEE